MLLLVWPLLAGLAPDPGWAANTTSAPARPVTSYTAGLVTTVTARPEVMEARFATGGPVLSVTGTLTAPPGPPTACQSWWVLTNPGNLHWVPSLFTEK